MNLPKMPSMPSAFMQGVIALLLLANFTAMLLGPSLFAGYKEPSAALTQTLVNLVILAVGYYLGSSSGSARKDEINATQQDKAISALAPAQTNTSLSSVAGEPQAVTITNDKPVDVAVVEKK